MSSKQEDRLRAIEELLHDHVPRQVAIPKGATGLVSEIGALIQRHAREVEQLKEAHRTEIQLLTGTLARMTQLVYQLEKRFLECFDSIEGGGKKSHDLRLLKIVKDQMKDLLADQGFLAVELKGISYTPQIADHARVERWIQGDGDRPIVTETIEPVVVRGEDVAMQGTIVVAASSKEKIE